MLPIAEFNAILGQVLDLDLGIRSQVFVNMTGCIYNTSKEICHILTYAVYAHSTSINPSRRALVNLLFGDPAATVSTGWPQKVSHRHRYSVDKS